MPLSLCVYCSASNHLDPHFVQAARDLGRDIAQKGHQLIYGGGNVGLMGELARAVHAHGGRVVGVIPTFMNTREIAYDAADELLVPANMRDRKALMEDRSDAFIALPGGFGTLEELAEILTLKQLHQHDKPIVIVNLGGFYDHLLAFFEHLTAQRFAKDRHRDSYRVAHDVASVWEHLP
ncbi:MAG: TIGR00730 family Rossman fold protein [Phycisphaeraceae bacterium]|nr:TIGR00730 family Rossman fold protein [Phycisphaeraceae bacterium]